MALDLTQNAYSSSKQIAKEPNLVLKIEGIDQFFGSSVISEYAKIGDPLEIGDPELNSLSYYIGGVVPLEGQKNLISFDGTSTSIKQTLNVDKGEGGSVTNMSISLLDDGYVTTLLTPGQVVDDLLYLGAKVYLGFAGTAFPDDYVTAFRGVITAFDSDAGKTILQINSPDDKKRSVLYKKVDTKLSGSITNSQTTLPLTSVANILQPILGADGNYDPMFKCYVRIDNEIIRYTGISGSSLTGCTRGEFSSTAVSHANGADVATFYRLTGNMVDMALKLMSSGFQGPYAQDIEVESLGNGEPNRIKFLKTNVVRDYNVQVGDFVTITDATNGGNNYVEAGIVDVQELDDGSYVDISAVTFVEELSSPAKAHFRSKYDTLPDGLRMTNDEIDISEHLRWYNLFLSSVNYDFYIKDTIDDAREFLEKQIYSPGASYSVPRKSRASMGYHIGPIPGQNIQTLDQDNLIKASRIKLKRSTNNNFYNEIIYKFDESAFEDDKFLSGVITISATSKNQIKAPNKTLIIEARGLRTNDLGESIATSQSNRRLKRYQFGAETLEVQPTFEAGFALEVGDILIYDGEDLNTPDTKSGTKGIAPRFYEIQNKDLNIKNGEVKLSLVDTSFSGQSRYCLMSPSSFVSNGVTASRFTIQQSFNGKFGLFEYRKWVNWVGASVRVRSVDYVTFDDAVILSVAQNEITLETALSFTPTAGMLMELSPYSFQPDKVKLVYGFMSPLAGGDPDYQML